MRGSAAYYGYFGGDPQKSKLAGYDAQLEDPESSDGVATPEGSDSSSDEATPEESESSDEATPEDPKSSDEATPEGLESSDEATTKEPESSDEAMIEKSGPSGTTPEDSVLRSDR